MSPYIKEVDREGNENGTIWDDTPGKFAYNITQHIIEFLDERRYQDKKVTNNFDDYATAVGVIELAKLELARRLIYPHEDKKIKENGDVK